MTQEKIFNAHRGATMLVLNIALFLGSIAWFVFNVRSMSVVGHSPIYGWGLAGSIVLFIAAIIHAVGFFVVQPNECRVMVLFGTYKGSVRENGFWWSNPFFQKIRVSLRARNLDGAKLKVNDRSGNPIDIAAVVVWRIKDSAQATFDVDDYRTYVTTQSEAAVRQLAGRYPYDAHVEVGSHEGEETISLLDGRDLVSKMLEQELSERLGRAGVEVIEARLAHLAYAPEIAGAMLQRQQAEAVVAARTKIVDGAVGMVEMALKKLAADGIIDLDDERKAAMVSNLLVVLCGDRAAHPVINAGSLYT